MKSGKGGRYGSLLMGMLFLAGPLQAQGWRLGVALEGQILPLGLAGFVEYQAGATGVQGRIGWDLVGGGFFLGSEGFWQPTSTNRYALGGVWYPGAGQAAKDLKFTGVMLFPCAGMRRVNSGWVYVGAGLPLQIPFYDRTGEDWGFLALIRIRMEAARSRNP
jgi:hypothetical protein